MKLFVRNTIFLLLFTFVAYQAAMAGNIKIDPILTTQQSWNGDALPAHPSGAPQMRVLTFNIPPKTKTGIHKHPYNGAGYVMSGALTLYATTDPDGDFSDPSKIKQITLKPGEA